MNPANEQISPYGQVPQGPSSPSSPPQWSPPQAQQRQWPRLIPDAHPWAVLGVGAAVYFGAMVANVIAIAITSISTTIISSDSLRDVAATGTIAAFGGPAMAVGLFVQAITALAGFIGICYLLRRRPPVELTRRGSVANLLWGCAIGAFAIGGSVLVLWFLGVYRVLDVAVTGDIVVGLMIGVGAALSEELFFRGILLHVLAVRFGAWPAIIIVSIVFGMLHSTNPGAGALGGFAIVLSAGLLLNAAYLLTGNLWLPIGIHFAWNFVQSGIFGITVSGTTEQRGLFASELVGPTWLSGGPMGVEGSVVLIALGFLAGLALAIYGSVSGNFSRERLTGIPPVASTA